MTYFQKIPTIFAVIPEMKKCAKVAPIPQLVDDIYNCLDTPPAGHSFQWNILKLVEKCGQKTQ